MENKNTPIPMNIWDDKQNIAMYLTVCDYRGGMDL
jgi:hypothetical protein